MFLICFSTAILVKKVLLQPATQREWELAAVNYNHFKLPNRELSRYHHQSVQCSGLRGKRGSSTHLAHWNPFRKGTHSNYPLHSLHPFDQRANCSHSSSHFGASSPILARLITFGAAENSCVQLSFTFLPFAKCDTTFMIAYLFSCDTSKS